MIVDTYLKYVNGKKTVIFCASVDHAAEIAKLLRDNGVKAEAVSGRDRVEIRDKILKITKPVRRMFFVPVTC